MARSVSLRKLVSAQTFPALKILLVEKKEANVVLVGALHDLDEVATQVEDAVVCLRPDQVALELCDRRFNRLFPLSLGTFAQLPLDERRFFLQRLRSGKDQLAAAVAAHRLGIPVAVCDRDYRVTEDRLLARLEPAILKAGALGALGLPSWTDLPVEEALEEAVATCIWDERDRVMAGRIQALHRGLQPLILAVVGLRHLEGLAHYLRQDIDPVKLDALCKPVQLSLWRRIMGQPILWRLRGTFGKNMSR